MEFIVGGEISPSPIHWKNLISFSLSSCCILLYFSRNSFSEISSSFTIANTFQKSTCFVESLCRFLFKTFFVWGTIFTFYFYRPHPKHFLRDCDIFLLLFKKKKKNFFCCKLKEMKNWTLLFKTSPSVKKLFWSICAPCSLMDSETLLAELALCIGFNFPEAFSVFSFEDWTSFSFSFSFSFLILPDPFIFIGRGSKSNCEILSFQWKFQFFILFF